MHSDPYIDVQITRPDSPPVVTHARTHRDARATGFLATLAGAPLVIGTTVGALLRSKRAGALAGGITALGLLVFRWQVQRLFTEQPAYEVISQVGKLQIRRYPAVVEARTRIEATDMDKARDTGFDRLACYIFGLSSTKEKLAMVSPVLLQQEGTTHVMAFIMPPERTKFSLPAPDDERVELVEIPERRYACITSRGGYRKAVVDEDMDDLLIACREAGLETRGRPVSAGFDPPWTIPGLRRSEIWVELI